MITLDGINLKEYFGIICEKQNHPLTPVFAPKTLQIPQKDGLYYFGSQTQQKEFSFNLAAIQKNKTSLQQVLRNFLSFIFNEYGKPRVLKLQFDYDPDKYYTVMCTSKIDIDRVLRTGKFSINLSAFNPYAYSIAENDEVRWGSEVINFESSYLLGHTGSDGAVHITGSRVFNLFVDGIAVKPKIIISGSANGMVITLGSQVITISNFTSSEFVIDCENYTIFKNGINGFTSVSLREFILMPGNNAVNVSATTINATVEFSYHDKYL